MKRNLKTTATAIEEDEDLDYDSEYLTPSIEFLTNLVGKKIKIFYFGNDDDEREGKDPIWFEGKLAKVGRLHITVESESDYRKIAIYAINKIYEKISK